MSEVPWAHAGVLLAAAHRRYTGRNRSASGRCEDLENEHRAPDSKCLGAMACCRQAALAAGEMARKRQTIIGSCSVKRKRMSQDSDQKGQQLDYSEFLLTPGS